MAVSKGMKNAVEVLLLTTQMLARVVALGAALMMAVWLVFIGTTKYTDVSGCSA